MHTFLVIDVLPLVLFQKFFEKSSERFFLLVFTNIDTAGFAHKINPSSSFFLHFATKRKQKPFFFLTSSRSHSFSNPKRTALLIIPGTLWCGQSHTTRSHTGLGTLYNTDGCCRRHDHCKTSIPGNTKRFNHYNTSPFTLSHCHCDAR